uniref:RING-type domain-containing protein n=1 Tax=viral metagenome TaxID=1070528 RepID=A0A6C0IJL9_9ZZZZ
MDNHIITILQNFQKPEASFLQDKECLICLEPIDLEALKIVKLPCGCSNSVYHIDCILKLLHSGKNKNFCPHCKTIYEIPLQQTQQTVARHQVLPYNVLNTEILPPNQQIHNLRIKIFTKIVMFHILTNSIMNINSIIISKICADYNGYEVLQVLMLFYFMKLFFNYCMICYAKNTFDKIEDCLIYSYTFQTVLFFTLIYILTKIKNDNNSTFLLVNNLFFSFIDVTFRIIREHKMNNTVNVIE